MPNKMLIDTSHPEETRVVVLRGNRVEEFDFESVSKKQLRGNIYLAKVTRVEPSLQAAFVDYGGNRHGFLAFSEIHPDYYQIPVVDRQALIEDEARAQRDEEEEEPRSQRRSRRFRQGERNGRRVEKRRGDDETLSEPFDAETSAGAEARPADTAPSAGSPERQTPPDDGAPSRLFAEAGDEDRAAASLDEPSREALDHREDGFERPEHVPLQESGAALFEASADDSPSFASEPDESDGGLEPLPYSDEASSQASRGLPDDQPRDDTDSFANEDRQADAPFDGEDETAEVEQFGGDALEEVPTHHHRYRRQYKIQEVIKRRQVLLVQVVKEERGNKGAALTTYLSLAGRYSVLMPNTARGGGISRKITDSTDRQRLKSIAQELEVPEGMGVILRTAGAARTKAEVKRDFEYLLRMWETVRETTLQSTAPTLVYEEGSLIKRAIRDLYNKDIDEVVVAGDEGYREAKEFMRLLMPSHAKNVQPYRDPQPVFAKYGAEAQLDAMFSNQVTLKSGGYIVINQTEALVAIDVNSGRSTREHNIEDTALRTNLEAVDEIARQLRLRDLAGLIVLDLIDMEEGRNNRAVERRLKDALKNDRARIQVGNISHFGLLEMSRQRIRSGVLEGSTVICPHCAGAGMVRSTASIALHVLRVLEDALIKNASYDIIVKTRMHVALYILNQKRANLQELENRFAVSVTIAADDSLTGTTYYALERGEPAAGMSEPLGAARQIEPPRVNATNGATRAPAALAESPIDTETEALAAESGAYDDEQDEAEDRRETDAEADGRPRRRRRRRRGRGGDREASGIAATAPQPPDDALGAIADIVARHPAPGAEASEQVDVEADAEPTPLEMEPAEPKAAVAGERRRSRRGGRGAREQGPAFAAAPDAEPEHEFAVEGEPASDSAVIAIETTPSDEATPPLRAQRSRRAPRPRAPKRLDAGVENETPSVLQDAGAADEAESQAAPREPVVDASLAPPPPSAEAPPRDVSFERVVADTAEFVPAIATPEPHLSQQSEPGPARPKRSGWWQRAKASLRE